MAIIKAIDMEGNIDTKDVGVIKDKLAMLGEGGRYWRSVTQIDTVHTWIKKRYCKY